MLVQLRPPALAKNRQLDSVALRKHFRMNSLVRVPPVPYHTTCARQPDLRFVPAAAISVAFGAVGPPPCAVHTRHIRAPARTSSLVHSLMLERRASSMLVKTDGASARRRVRSHIDHRKNAATLFEAEAASTERLASPGPQRISSAAEEGARVTCKRGLALFGQAWQTSAQVRPNGAELRPKSAGRFVESAPKVLLGVRFNVCWERLPMRRS